MKYATYTAGGVTYYGAVTDAGMIPLNGEFPAVANFAGRDPRGGLADLEKSVAGKTATHTDYQFEMVLPNAPRILCVGGNFPDRNAGRRISQADAYDHIAALTLCNEGTIRDCVRHAKFNVTQGKSWDNSGSIGPW